MLRTSTARSTGTSSCKVPGPTVNAIQRDLDGTDFGRVTGWRLGGNGRVASATFTARATFRQETAPEPTLAGAHGVYGDQRDRSRRRWRVHERRFPGRTAVSATHRRWHCRYHQHGSRLLDECARSGPTRIHVRCYGRRACRLHRDGCAAEDFRTDGRTEHTSGHGGHLPRPRRGSYWKRRPTSCAINCSNVLLGPQESPAEGEPPPDGRATV